VSLRPFFLSASVAIRAVLAGRLEWDIMLQTRHTRAGFPTVVFLLTRLCYSESNIGEGNEMARFVEITTPIPTLDEIGDRLGMSQARRTRVLKIIQNSSPGKFTTPRTRATSIGVGKKVAARKKS
jgi:hypothetical protein